MAGRFAAAGYFLPNRLVSSAGLFQEQAREHVLRPLVGMTMQFSAIMTSLSKPSIPARVLLVAQRIYKLTLSPLVGQQCRYLPTCSDYAAGCVAAFGAWRGSWMGLARICRCRPGGGAGYDPVPLTCATVPAWTPWRYGDWRNGLRVGPSGETSNTTQSEPMTGPQSISAPLSKQAENS